MEKVIKDDKVAVCYSPGYGAGWYTWDAPLELVFHPKIVEMVLAHRQREIDRDWLVSNIGTEYADVYCGSACTLEVKWLPVGSKFIIEEYDGYESIRLLDNINFITA